MFASPIVAQSYARNLSFDSKRSDKSRYDAKYDEREKEKAKTEEEEKRPGDLAVA